MKSYKQTTYETCLAVSLMLLVGIKPSKRKEISIWKAGWEFNFLIGQINYFCQKYNKGISVYVENTFYYNDLIKQKNNSVTIINKKNRL
jgi:hypothetical protein